ncbi:MAG: formimidoylglutamate deiminase [Pseudonocardiaceae bacterium]
MNTYWCEQAWLPDGVACKVEVRSGSDGRIVAVRTGVPPVPGVHRLPGLVLPGMANAHSHAFHRALRGRTQGSTFLRWRTEMYDLARRLDPDRYLALATAVYAELVVAGWTCLGEFHYLHHDRGGRRYAQPTVMADALRAAAGHARIRLTLLDTCYLTGGFGMPLAAEQARFGDATVAAWADRLGAHPADTATSRTGAAIHSVRAVPRHALPDVVAATGARPLHVHLAEQVDEVVGCRAAHGVSPARLLHDTGVLSERTTVVHAIHLDDTDIRLLGAAGVSVAACPSTEADLADGIGPFADLAAVGCPIVLGSDQHVVVDPFAEARALEHGQRLRTGRRGRFTVGELVRVLTGAAHAALGWPGDGVLAPGAACDLVAVRADSARTAGCLPAQILLAATASDVHTVVVGGAVVAEAGRHVVLGDVGTLLRAAIGEVWACAAP